MYVIAMADAELPESGYAQSSLSSRLKGGRGSLAGKVREFEGEGNNSSAREITLNPYTPPNLQVTALAAPERAVRGQKFHLEYTVTKAGGAKQSLQGRWDDLIYRSSDHLLDLTAERKRGVWGKRVSVRVDVDGRRIIK